MAEIDPGITGADDSYSTWFNDAIRVGGLVADSPTRGAFILPARGTALWENIRRQMTDAMAEYGVEQVTMPTLIPLSLLMTEADHVDGFAPEVYKVTHAGSNELADPLVVRPTSEVMVTEFLKGIVQGHSDLPRLYNMWNSAFRAEKRTRPLMRSTEFQWQEGHSAHATDEEADEHARAMAEMYRDFLAGNLCLYAIMGEKSENERFPGADRTYALEGSYFGRALQLATAHNLGTGFAESQGVMFTDRDGVRKPVHQTSWGSSTRLMAAIVMGHGDETGIVLPPQVAPERITIVPAWRGDKDQAQVTEFATRLARDLGSRAVVAPRKPDERLGAARYKAERTGSPLYLVIGPREMDSGELSYKLRHSGETGTVALRDVRQATDALLDRTADEMYARSKQKQEDALVRVTTRDELLEAVEAGKMAVAGWAGTKADERRLKDETGVTIRIHPDGPEFEPAKDPTSRSRKPGRPAIFSRSY